MDPQMSEDTMSVASNDAFEDLREDFRVATFCDDSSDNPTIAEATGLPITIANEIIPRLDRLIQLMEAQLNRPVIGKPNVVVPKAILPNAKLNMARIKKEKRAARRRNQNVKAKGRARFFQRNAANDSTTNGESAREKYNAAQRNQTDRSFNSCWPKSEDPYEEDGSYRVCTVCENKCASMSW